MAETVAVIPIVRTKLHHPRVPPDYVRRRRLQETLDTFRSRPLTLVSAAAGYGKSVLVSAWLDDLDCRSAWVSLEESDSDLRQFLAYVVAAVRGVFAPALAQTAVLLGAANLPPVAVLSGTLINELDEFDEPLVLALDDVHRIRERSVSDLLAQW